MVHLESGAGFLIIKVNGEKTANFSRDDGYIAISIFDDPFFNLPLRLSFFLPFNPGADRLVFAIGSHYPEWPYWKHIPAPLMVEHCFISKRHDVLLPFKKILP